MAAAMCLAKTLLSTLKVGLYTCANIHKYHTHDAEI